MSKNNEQEATVMGALSDTFRGALKQADDAPPALVCLVGPTEAVGKQWLITKPDMTIGRSTDCDIYVNDVSLSRSHAKIMQAGFDVVIMDMNSTNKTSVNDQLAVPMVQRKLHNSDRIKAGNVIFKFLEKGSIEIVTNQKTLEKAQKDALTGAYSKGALLEKGPEIIQRAKNLGEPLSVITFDIDFFKKVNDNFGHPGGDYVLRELGKLMQARLVRANDYFARFGGEEFVTLLQATNIKTASEVAERIRQTVEAHEFIFEGKKVPVTISIGVAQFSSIDTWESVYDRADKALYSSKQNGRNKVTVAG
ncbi:GGDEF domain-containing protein [Bdellovibrio sp. qaytius]|nr:GGDEF domain-containing protein [Bdellovibrio sp. qaytius]